MSLPPEEESRPRPAASDDSAPNSAPSPPASDGAPAGDALDPRDAERAAHVQGNGAPADAQGEANSMDEPLPGREHDPEPLPFPVIGIGASAGGLDALRRFFEGLPDAPGMAFIIVQHLSPDHESQLAELIQTHTGLAVAQVADSPEVRPDHVYVIPPGKSLRIRAGRLQLSEPDRPRGHRAPIDLFFRSLAADQAENATAVVLSGTGSDGALGIKAIKEAGGLTLAQAPDDAEYDGMPMSAVRTGLVDVDAAADVLGRRLSEILQHAARLPLPARTEAGEESEGALLTETFRILRDRTDHDFTSYKRSTVNRRIGRRLQVHGLDSLAAYVERLRNDPDEAGALLRDLLISVTSFFRDPDAFAALDTALPSLFARKGPSDTVRAWVPGCATGEEAYSIAMLLCEHASALERPPQLQLFATDIDEDALAVAREGLYPETVAADVSPERLQRFFQVDGNGYRVKKEIREIVLFAAHNLVKSPPFSRLDLISCRNLLIYLQRGIQGQVFEVFHYALRPGGLLFLGTSESADGTSADFAHVDKKQRLFRRSQAPATLPRLPRLPLALPDIGRDRTPGTVGPRLATSPVEDASTLEARYAEHTLARHAPPRLLVDRRYEVTHVFGDAGRFLTEREGRVTQDVLQRVPEALRPDLRTALYAAAERGEATTSRFLRLDTGDAAGHVVRLRVAPLTEAGLDHLLEVVFEVYEEDTLGAAAAAAAVEHDGTDPLVTRLEDELEATRRRLQAAVEEHETSDEELRASNEELQSMNEELQSTAEELETGKEELQSMNEELITVNQELKTKIEELGRAYSDLQNLMAATKIATVFLDRTLRLKRYTPRAADLFHVIPSDVGRPFGHLTHRLDHPDVPGLAQRVLDTLVSVEEEVRDQDGGWYLLRMFPYRTVEDQIDGVVVTLFDVGELKETERALTMRAEQQAAVAALGQLAVSGVALDALFDEACRRVAAVLGNELCKVLQRTDDGEHLLLRVGVGWNDGFVGAAMVPNDEGSQAGYTLLATEPVIVEDVAEETRFSPPDLLTEHDVVSGMSVPIHGPDGPWGVLGTHGLARRDFTDDDARFLQSVAHVLGEAIRRTHSEDALHERIVTLAAVIESLPDAVYIGDESGVTQCNRYALDLVGASSLEDLQGRPAELARQFNVRWPETGEPLEPDAYPFFRALRGETAVEEVAATNARTGEEVFLRTAAAPILLDGAVVGAVGVSTDITHRRRMEEALRQSEAENREHLQEIEAIYETAPVGMAFIDPDLRYRRVNSRLAEINGKGVEEHLGRPVRAVLPQLAAELEPLLEQIMETGEAVHDIEIRGHTASAPDEERVWLASYVPQYDASGGIEGINAVVRDITDRKRTEEALAQSREALAEEQARLEEILQQLPVGVIIGEAPDGHLQFTNEAARRLVRKTTLWEEHGDAFDQWVPHRADGTSYSADTLPMRRVIRDGETIRGEENRFRRTDGSWLCLRLYAGPVRDAEGAIIAGVIAFEDVTEEKQTLDELETLTETLEERVSERTDQVRSLSSALSMAEQHERARIAQVLHDDLQQVLYGLRLRLQEVLEALKRPSAPDTREADTREMTEEGLQHAGALLDRALRITRTLTLDLKPPVLSAEGLETSLSWLAHHMYETYGLDVGVNVQSPVQLSDRHLHVLLFQLVRELLFNVVKHASVEEAEMTVGIAEDADGVSRLRVAVEDRGRGFDADAFAGDEMDPSRAGFGLYSVKERLALLGGHMDITSSPGSGTRVLLTLPLDGSSSLASPAVP